ncbi:MAG: transposase [Chloroflexi bacterium]|nr:transposase [Chloroflexota bacterium]
MKGYEGGRAARVGIGAYMRLYNNERPHQALGYRTPAEVFMIGTNADALQHVVESPQPSSATQRVEATGSDLNMASFLSY